MKRQIACAVAASGIRQSVGDRRFPGGWPRDFWIRSMETIPITGKRVHDARLFAVLHYPLATIRQLPQAACQAHPRCRSPDRDRVLRGSRFFDTHSGLIVEISD